LKLQTPLLIMPAFQLHQGQTGGEVEEEDVEEVVEHAEMPGVPRQVQVT